MNIVEDVPGPRPMRTAYRVALRREIETMVAQTPRRWRRSSLAIAFTLVTAAGGVGVAAAAYTHYQRVSNLTTAHCYSLPQLGDNGTTIAVLNPSSGSSRVVDALGSCGMLWRDGFLSPGVSSIVRVTQTTTVHQVPSLVVCTMPDGTAGVFPGTAVTCANLGLAEPDTSTTIQ